MHLSAYIDMEKGNGAAVVMAALFLCPQDRKSGLPAEKEQISACQIRGIDLRGGKIFRRYSHVCY